MKKIILLSLLALGVLPGLSQAQTADSLPNNGFEAWDNTAMPVSWDSSSAISNKGYVFNGAQTGGTVQRLTMIQYSTGGPQIHVYPHQGKNFIELVTNTTSGKVHVGYIKTKYAYAKRPGFFFAQMGFFSQAAEAPVVAITFTKWNTSTNKQDTVLNVAAQIPASQNILVPWTEAYIDLSKYYKTSDNPDTAIVQFQSSGGVYNGSAFSYANNTTLIIDNGAFTTNMPAGIEMTEVGKQTDITAYPNPFSGATTIHYTLRENGNVNLSVYDMNSKEVARLVNRNQVAGTYDQTFDATGLHNGIYIYKLQTSAGMQTGKLILNK